MVLDHPNYFGQVQIVWLCPNFFGLVQIIFVKFQLDFSGLIDPMTYGIVPQFNYVM